jgi:hypothetical protein
MLTLRCLAVRAISATDESMDEMKEQWKAVRMEGVGAKAPHGSKVEGMAAAQKERMRSEVQGNESPVVLGKTSC